LASKLAIKRILSRNFLVILIKTKQTFFALINPDAGHVPEFRLDIHGKILLIKLNDFGGFEVFDVNDFVRMGDWG
jgi:hypothetical protein